MKSIIVHLRNRNNGAAGVRHGSGYELIEFVNWVYVTYVVV